MGYPADLAAFEFDPNFAIRGLIFDKNYGNFVKVWGCDAFGSSRLANLQPECRSILFSLLLHFPRSPSAMPLEILLWCATATRHFPRARLMT
jgi:hypothetical protein